MKILLALLLVIPSLSFSNDQKIYDQAYALYLQNDNKGAIKLFLEIPNNIEELLPLTNKDSICPKISVGSHCNKPYSCDYFERCDTTSNQKQITPFTILPYIGKSKDLTDYQTRIMEYLVDSGIVSKENAKLMFDEAEKNLND